MKWRLLDEGSNRIPVWEHIGNVTECDIEFDTHVGWGDGEIFTTSPGKVFIRTGTITEDGFTPETTFPSDG